MNRDLVRSMSLYCLWWTTLSLIVRLGLFFYTDREIEFRDFAAFCARVAVLFASGAMLGVGLILIHKSIYGD